MKLLRTTTHSPYVNLALEEELMQGNGEAVMLWVNDPCVVIGRNQNPYWEADLDYLAAQHIALVRRLSGGGAVFHDQGNLNYSFVSDEPCAERAARLAINALAHVGVTVCPSGRNDLTVGNRKIGGMAERFDGRFLCHGTILVDVNLSAMERSLRPSPLKLGKHGVDSVRSRVVNLASLSQNVTVDRLISAFEDELRQKARALEPTHKQTLERASQLQERAWLMGGSPARGPIAEAIVDGDLYQFGHEIHEGGPATITVHTDAQT